MTLTHTPAHSAYYPERFENEETGWGYSVKQDTDTSDPRNDVETDVSALWAFLEPALSSSVATEKPEGNIAIDAFAHYFEQFDEQKSLQMTRRYLAAFHPEEKVSVVIQTIRGYSQGDWLDVVAAVADGHGTPESVIDQFRMWVFGDVWLVIPDRGTAISGIYADDAEAALAIFRGEYEDSDSTLEPEVPVLDPFEERETDWSVAWSVDEDSTPSAAEAAISTWQDMFGRGPKQPAPTESCVFVVTDRNTGENVTVDLSDQKFSHLFEGPRSTPA